MLALGGGALWMMRERLVFPQPTITAQGGDPDSGWLPFASRRQPVVTVQAKVNGVSTRALVDSGAQHSVIDSGFAEQMEAGGGLSAPVIAYGVGGSPQMGKTLSVDLELGGLRLQGLRAASLDLGPIAEANHLDTPLVLGQDLLRALAADIDFPGRRIRFVRSQSFTVPEGARLAPVRARGRALEARVMVEGVELEAIVDTGASAALSLASDVAEAAGLLDGRRVQPGQAIVLGGVAPGRIVRASHLTFAGLVREDVPVHIFEPQNLPGFPRGLLGYDALRPFRVIMDHRGGAMHLIGGE